MYQYAGLFGQWVTVFPSQGLLVVRTGQDTGSFTGDAGWQEEMYRRMLASITDGPITSPDPAPGADEFYHADLMGLTAVTVAGDELGTIIAVQNFGAGDLLEIAPRRGETLLVPFTRAVVPEVDLAGKRVVVDPPPGLIDGADEDGERP